jgi:hypothetical protein
MKYTLIIFPLILAFFTSCATSSLPTVKTDYDNEADFTEFASFNWSDEIENQKDSHPILDNSLVRKRIKNAIRSEMEGRGYEFAESADLLVNFHVVIEEKTGYTTTPSFGYRYWARDNVQPYNYKEGTLIIDLIDKKQNQLVWQGYTEGIIDNNPEKMEEKMRAAISLIFKEYNHRSGS